MPDAAPRLVVFFARVGDLVMLTPFLRAAASEGPIELLARPWAADLLGEQPWLSAIHVLAKPNRGGLPDWLHGSPRKRMGANLAGRGFRELIVMDKETPAIAAWVASWRGSASERLIRLKAQPRHTHNVDAYRAAGIAAGLPEAAFEAAPRLDLPPARLAAARARLAPLGRRVIAVQAGSSATHRLIRKQINVKGLAPEQWARLLTRILDAGDADAAVLHGSAFEGREAAAIIKAMPAAQRVRLHDWTGKVPLAELPSVLAASYATLSVDTGPGHIAAAVGCPLLSIFGPTNPAEYLPRGPGAVELLLGRASCQFCQETRAYRDCRRNICLRDLPDDEVHAAWLRLAARIPAQGSAASR